jgi:hypothetical protein
MLRRSRAPNSPITLPPDTGLARQVNRRPLPHIHLWSPAERVCHGVIGPRALFVAAYLAHLAGLLAARGDKDARSAVEFV